MIIRTIGALGAQIRRARRDAGMTQLQLAEQAGVSRSWLIGVERGANPRAELNLVLKVLGALDLHVGLLRGNDPPSPAEATSGSSLNDIIVRHRTATPPNE